MGPVDAAPPHLAGTDAQRRDGPRHGFLVQPARSRHPLAQADDTRKGIDHAKALALGPGNQQSAIVGAQIERRIGATPRPGLG